MGHRNIIIEEHASLGYSNNHMIIQKDEKVYTEFLDNINSVIINSLQVRISTYLLNELAQRNIRVIFTDEKKRPSHQLIPLHGTFDSYGKRKEQLSWSEEQKDSVWAEVVRNKIINQSALIKRLGMSFNTNKYLKMIESGDPHNAEGYAARSYFIKLFGKDFSRRSDIFINAALNYGYSILFSLTCRTISAYGYSLQFGIHHDSNNNNYNFGCDIMEPFRPFVDRIVIENIGAYSWLSKELKNKLIDVSSLYVRINRKEYRLDNAMEEFFLSVVKSLKGKNQKIRMVHEL